MGITRRGCLEAGLAFSLTRPASSEPAASSAAGPADSSFDPWIEIHPDNLRHNIQEVSRRVGKRPILAVIKNNGYGLGVENVSRVFGPLPEVAGCAVVKLDEAFRVAESGFKKPILLMGPFDDKNIEEMATKNILPMVYTPLSPGFDRAARQLQRPIEIHMCVDTGLGREGVPHREAAGLIRDLAANKNVRIAGTMMTFTEDLEFDKEQMNRFSTLCAMLISNSLSISRSMTRQVFA